MFILKNNVKLIVAVYYVDNFVQFIYVRAVAV